MKIPLILKVLSVVTRCKYDTVEAVPPLNALIFIDIHTNNNLGKLTNSFPNRSKISFSPDTDSINRHVRIHPLKLKSVFVFEMPTLVQMYLIQL